MRYGIWLVGLVSVGIAACKDNTGTGTGTKAAEVRVSVEGTLQLLPFETGADFSQLKVAVVDPGALILNADAPPLGEAALDATQCAEANATTCPFLVPNVLVSGTDNLGLALQIIDQRASGSQVWPPLYTGIALADTVATALEGKTDIGGCTAAVLSVAAFAKLATAVGQSADDLIARGSMLGVVLGRASEATMASQGVPPPQAGVTASSPDTHLSVWYPNADLTGSQSTTAASGVLLMASNRSNTEVTSLKLTAASNDTHTYTAVEAQSVGSTPKHILFLEFQADN